MQESSGQQETNGQSEQGRLDEPVEATLDRLQCVFPAERGPSGIGEVGGLDSEEAVPGQPGESEGVPAPTERQACRKGNNSSEYESQSLSP
jgi:hypothetical protein